MNDIVTTVRLIALPAARLRAHAQFSADEDRILTELQRLHAEPSRNTVLRRALRAYYALVTDATGEQS